VDSDRPTWATTGQCGRWLANVGNDWSMWTVTGQRGQRMVNVDSDRPTWATTGHCGQRPTNVGNDWSMWTVTGQRAERLVNVDSDRPTWQRMVNMTVTDQCGLVNVASDRLNVDDWSMWTMSDLTITVTGQCHHATMATTTGRSSPWPTMHATMHATGRDYRQCREYPWPISVNGRYTHKHIT